MNNLIPINDKCVKIRCNNGCNIIGYMNVPGSSLLRATLPDVMYVSTRVTIPVNLRNGLKLL